MAQKKDGARQPATKFPQLQKKLQKQKTQTQTNAELQLGTNYGHRKPGSHGR